MARPQRGKRSRRGGRRWLRWLVTSFVLVLILSGLAVGAAAFWVLTILPRSLPSVTAVESFDPSEGAKVYDDNDELITEFHVERRIFVPLAQIPKALQDAVIATEDARFYSHHGVDPTGIARAIYQNWRRGRIVEGGSTITQQLAKVLFLTPDKSLERKLKEAVLALLLERRYSKDRILELYLNQIYFGQGAFGVEAAARTFFGKSIGELTLAESALLAGLPTAPATYSPFDHPDAAKRRRGTAGGGEGQARLGRGAHRPAGGSAARPRAPDRLHQGDGRRLRLLQERVQPRRAGAAPARLRLQAVRLHRRARVRYDPGQRRRGRSGRVRGGEEQQAVEARQLRPEVPRPDHLPAGPRGVDQRRRRQGPGAGGDPPHHRRGAPPGRGEPAG